MTVEWSEATDNVAVTGYEVYVGDEKQTTTETSFILKNLTCQTEYLVKVRAFDAAGNYSVIYCW